MSRTRRLFGLGAVIPILALSMPATAAGVDRSSPQLVAGVLQSGAGTPSSGRVVVFHDDLRDNNRLQLMSTSLAGSDGRYSVNIRATRDIQDAAASNDGFAHFIAYAVTGAGISDYRFFSAKLERGAWKGSATANLGKVNLSASRPLPSRDFPKQLDAAIRTAQAKLDQRVATPNTTPDEWLFQCYYTVYSTFQSRTMVSELHNDYPNLQAVALYGRTDQADSNISVGIRATKYKVNFSASGTNHIGNSNVTEVKKNVWGSYGKALNTLFQYQRWRHHPDNGLACQSPPAPYEILKSTRWQGDTLGAAWDDSRFDGQCLTTYSQYKVRLDAGADWARFSNDYTGYTWTMNVAAGITYNNSSWSGASTRVGHEYHNPWNAPTAYICGNNEMPAFALRIFAGH